MMYGHEKSDPAIVAVKPTNKAEASAAEWVEPRAGTEGNARQLSTRRTPSRVSVTQDVGSSTAANCRRYPRWEPYAGKPHVRIWAGGREVTRVPTANAPCMSLMDHLRRRQPRPSVHAFPLLPQKLT